MENLAAIVLVSIGCMAAGLLSSIVSDWLGRRQRQPEPELTLDELNRDDAT
jgi:hypothetical protein